MNSVMHFIRLFSVRFTILVALVTFEILLFVLLVFLPVCY